MVFCIPNPDRYPVHLGKTRDEKGVEDVKAEIRIYQAELKDLDKAAAMLNQYRRFYEREDDLDGARQYIREG